ncbi:MRP-L47-domain-containing protein [Daldinia decipiens]|uniref:MRP-L47-domain-containing protein n=1 Tax=Daldinia decipiens TaxID=326647 RepID=UPI0020C42311|nr:MRP-L47-domain-containing protein [Daldinia decipiens]KAI1660813.1 MRP-L47-domain-containing protein [Daldinia decipiens]
MATTTSVRPAIGRIISAAGSQHVANPSFLSVLLIRAATQSCPFSSTSDRSMRRARRDNNKQRGLSSIYRSGPRFRMNVDKNQIPKPVDFKPDVKVDPNHGLWGFFYSKEKLLLTPDEDSEHGRGWTVEELRHKSWEDLHKLWWVCVKEQNRIATARKEKARLKLKNGVETMEDRLSEVRKTMKSIKHALTERYYVWEDARKLAGTDPEIDLANTSRPYNPSSYFDEDVKETEPAEEQKEAQQEASSEQQEESGKSTAENVDPSTLPPSATEPQQPSTRA